MKQINRTPVPVPGAKTTPRPKATPSRTPVPLPGAKATPKPKATPSRTPVPLPGATTARKSKDTPSKTQLSQEFIASDDDDSSSDNDSSAEDAPQAKPVEKPKIPTGVHKPNGVVKSTPKSNKKDNVVRKIALTPQASVRKPLVTPAPVSAPVSGGKRKADVSASDSDSDSSSSSDTSDSSSDEPTTQQAPQQQTPQPISRQLQSPGHVVAFVPTQPYVPPKGFAPVPVNETTTSNVGSIFNNLDGKQVWHITAPAGVSLANLQELTMEDLMGGKTVLNEKGAEYRFSVMDKSEDGALEVMIPRQDGYQAVPTRISRTLHVQAVARTPALTSRQADQSSVSIATASITRSTIRPPRPQVKRLKMRFLPSGFVGNVAGTLGDPESETESPQRTTVSETPDELRLPLRTEKQKQHVNGVGAVDLTSTRSKKHRTPEEIKRREERRAKKEKRRAQEAARVQP